MGCTYVKEFKFAKGGLADLKQDKATIKQAVHKHEKVQHPGQPLTMLKKGGVVKEKSTKEVYPSREVMTRHEAKETPRMQQEELIKRAKVVAPARRSVPVAPVQPLVMMCGGRAKKK